MGFLRTYPKMPSLEIDCDHSFSFQNLRLILEGTCQRVGDSGRLRRRSLRDNQNAIFVEVVPVVWVLDLTTTRAAPTAEINSYSFHWVGRCRPMPLKALQKNGPN